VQLCGFNVFVSTVHTLNPVLSLSVILRNKCVYINSKQSNIYYFKNFMFKVYSHNSVNEPEIRPGTEQCIPIGLSEVQVSEWNNCRSIFPFPSWSGKSEVCTETKHRRWRQDYWKTIFPHSIRHRHTLQQIWQYARSDNSISFYFKMI